MYLKGMPAEGDFKNLFDILIRKLSRKSVTYRFKNHVHTIDILFLTVLSFNLIL